MKIKLFLFISFISFISFGQNQKLIDSLLKIHDDIKDKKEQINILNNVGRLYGSGDIEKASYYNKKAVELSKQIDYPRGIAYGYLFLSSSLKKRGYYSKSTESLIEGIYDLKNYDFPKGSIELNTRLADNLIAEKQYDSAKVYLSNSFSRANKIDYYQGIITIYLKHASIYQNQDNNLKALEYYLKVDSICSNRNVKNDPDCAVAVSNIGHIKAVIRDFDEAEKYYKQALDYFKSLKTQKSAAINTINSLGNIELERNNFVKAEEYYREALDFYLEAKMEFKIGYMYSQLANLYGKQKRFNDAENVAIKGLEISRNLNDSIRIVYGLNILTNIKMDQKEYDESISYGQESLKTSKNIKKPSLVLKSMSLLSRVYYKSKNYKKSAETISGYVKYKDSIDKIQNKKVLLELETKYQTEKKEQEIKLLTSENALIEKQKKNQRLILLSAITISSLSALFLFFLLKSRRKVNKKLRELDATKSRFFANISHEFRTPLTLISNPIEEGIEDKSLSEEKREQFKVAKRNSDRLLTLVNQLLDLSKIDANQLKLNIEKAELTPFIAALADSFSYSAQQKEINYIVNIECNTIEAYFDRDAIEKIITNLIANAIKYTPNKEQIKLSCSIVEEQLLFEIKNSGLQLQQNELNSLFNRFYQTNEEHSGSGIGLALVKELVDLHRGSITVNNTEDNWISFSVKLPVDYKSYKNETFVTSVIKDNLTKVEAYKDAIYTQEDDISINDDKPILLIVEDHADIRNLVKGLFSDTYRILVATNGEEGIDLAIEHVPDIIISDVMMPIKDGIALTQHLKNDERTSHIPIVLLTAKAGDSNELLGIEVGADDYITKPFNSKILTTKVEKLIKNRRLLQERYSQELVLLPKDVAVTNIDEQFLERLQHVLDTNLVEPTFSASRFSEAIGMSRMQLHRKLKALTGLTTSEFIRSQRIKLAAELLKKSDANVSEIGYSVGFNDHSYFTKCFKEIYGCSPTEYISKL